jgi:hypothetical protein
VARPTDQTRAFKRLPPRDAIQRLRLVLADLETNGETDADGRALLHMVLTHLVALGDDTFSLLGKLSVAIDGLNFGNPAAPLLLKAEVARYPLLIDPQERTKCWDRLHRALVEEPPKTKKTADADAVMVGEHHFTRPALLADKS